MNASALDPYFALPKSRIVTMVLVTTALGFFVGGHGIDSPLILVMTLLGTALSAGGRRAQSLFGTRCRRRHASHS
jgi:heme O synthase-like polyprenyltransferase